MFGLINGLAGQGLLSEAEEAFRRDNNAWYDQNYTNPSAVMPDVYDRDLHPHATAWFKESATHLLARVDGYLAILAAHDVPCERVESDNPGRVIYEDDDQIVVVPS
ncbi:MAG: hypothetical protein Q7T73_03420 [Beijerinckiaceae bacterium]|nr:hypothetical protein [Beijerinckiaceae bacterium]